MKYSHGFFHFKNKPASKCHNNGYQSRCIDQRWTASIYLNSCNFCAQRCFLLRSMFLILSIFTCHIYLYFFCHIDRFSILKIRRKRFVLDIHHLHLFSYNIWYPNEPYSNFLVLNIPQQIILKILLKARIDRIRQQYVRLTVTDRNTTWRQVSSGTHMVHQQKHMPSGDNN